MQKGKPRIDPSSEDADNNGDDEGNHFVSFALARVRLGTRGRARGAGAPTIAPQPRRERRYVWVVCAGPIV
jgi:hypothetical protein